MLPFPTLGFLCALIGRGCQATILDISGDDWVITSDIPANQLPEILPLIKSAYRDTVRNTSQIKLLGQVPGYVLTDLERHDIIAHPLHRNHDVTFRPLSRLSWKYAKNVTVQDLVVASRAVLEFEGIDTFADIIINGRYFPEIGAAQNQFKPRRLLLTKDFLMGRNWILIEVIVKSAITETARLASKYPHTVPPTQFPDVQHGERFRNFARKSPASFSWDWGPAFVAQGIWKPVTFTWNQTYVAVKVDHVVHARKVRVFREGGNWIINQTFIYDCLDDLCNEAFDVRLSLTNQSQIIPIKTDLLKHIIDNQLNLNLVSMVRSSDVELWYPQGHGDPVIYDLSYNFESVTSSESYAIPIGFRTVKLLQETLNCTKADTHCQTFEFEINGATVYVRGANLVPVSPFQVDAPSCTGTKLEKLLSLASQANINMLRVWGGGIYLPSCFYEKASRLGIMVWQEFMFACSTYPADPSFLRNVREEVMIQAGRLNKYPALTVFGGNNENKQALQEDWYHTAENASLFVKEYQELYAGTIRTNVIDMIDVPFLMSSPSNGESGTEWINDNPNSKFSGDVHYYNYQPDCLSGGMFPVTRFTSEFGYQAYPGLRTLREALQVRDVTLADQNTNHRQHLVMGNGLLYAQINFMFGERPLETLRNENLTYLSQLYQATCMAEEVSHHRRYYRRLTEDGEGWNTGVMYWQLNDIWAAPSWASIDSVLRPKMLFYVIRDLYQSVISTSRWNGTAVEVYGINEEGRPEDYDLDIFLVDPSRKGTLHEWGQDGTLPPRSVTKLITIPDKVTSEFCEDLTRCFIAVEFVSEGARSKITNIVLPSPHGYQYLEMKKPDLKPQVIQKDLEQGRFVIRLVAEQTALWVYLEADRPGVFSENAFSMYGLPAKLIVFRTLAGVISPGEDCCNFTVTSYFHHALHGGQNSPISF